MRNMKDEVTDLGNGTYKHKFTIDNPNVIQVELTLSQLEYMEAWSKKLNGTPVDSIIRMMIDTMMRTQPQLAEVTR